MRFKSIFWIAHSDAIRISGKNVDWPTEGKCDGKYTAGAARVFFVGPDLRREMIPSARGYRNRRFEIRFRCSFATEFKMKRARLRGRVLRSETAVEETNRRRRYVAFLRS